MIKLNKNYNENCLDTMNKIQNNFIDLIITSPPYDKLRDYKGYKFNFKSIANQLYRILKPGGVIVWVVGDSTIKGSETGTSFKQALYFKEIGLNLHDTMIYQKNNFSNPSNNRYHQIFEYMFILSKGKPKTFNSIKDRKNVYGGKIGSWGKNTSRQKDGSMKENSKKIINEYGQRYNIWKYKTSKNGQNDEISYKHPATFPEELVKDHIISWSNKNDIIYDPLMGSGTTAKMSILNNRNWIGSEISSEYCDIIDKRIKNIKN